LRLVAIFNLALKALPRAILAVAPEIDAKLVVSRINPREERPG
jgi:hypothetical protein